MASATLLLISSSLMLMIVLFQTSLAKPSSSCNPSSCGNIHNIRYPFRLKSDKKHCSNHLYELACKNNLTFISLNSHKYYVKHINYHNKTIRLVDASINNHDICSFPNSSLYAFNFSHINDLFHIPFYYDDLNTDLQPINFMTCTTPLKNSSLFTDISHDCAPKPSLARFTYINVGHMKASDVPETCGLDLIVMTSWKFKNPNNISLSQIHHSLLYGFKLTFFDMQLEKLQFYLGLVLVIVFILGPLLCTCVNPLLMIINGITAAAGFSCFSILHFWINYAHFQSIRSTLMVPSIIAQIIIDFMILAPRIILFPFALWILIYKFRRRRLSEYNTIEKFLQSDNKLTPIRYSYSDIKKITKKFQDKLGEGGYGSVYKGKLRSGLDVAVKIIKKSGANGQDFMNEISTIGRIHHVNVVKLVGYCAQGTKHALVFDFMPNGSLEKFLFNRETMNSLSWDTKFGIAVGIARGIEYLHIGCDIQILHFDIKPHNILLDDKFVPKISDFGLAKFCSIDKNTISMTAARGTIGYVAPELINRGIGSISNKADVYSFGMLLMEMVNLNKHLKRNNCDSSQYFPNWIYDHFNQGKDIDIGIADENDESDNMRKLARKIAIVGLWCIQMNPDDRPSMNKVLEMLEGDVELVQIPSYPSQTSTQIEVNVEGDTTSSASSLPLVLRDDVLSCVDIIVTN